MLFKIFSVSILSIALTSCSTYHFTGDVSVNIPDQTLTLPESDKASINQESAVHLIQLVQFYDYQKWKADLQKIKDTYITVIPVLEDSEIIQFSMAFFKTITFCEQFDQEIANLSNQSDKLPNVDTLKFFYRSEKHLDNMIEWLAQFANSSNQEIASCADKMIEYFRLQKSVLETVRDVDYRSLACSQMPHQIPPAVLKAKAQFLEQRDQMVSALYTFYRNLSIQKSAS